MKAITYATTPSLSPVIDGELWELSKDWNVTVRGTKETLPKGFLTDGASIPRILWRVCGHPMATKRIIPAIVHDAIYAGTILGFTRKEADEIFRDGIIEAGWPKWKAHIEYAALRLFGSPHWRASAKAAAILTASLVAFLAGCAGPKSRSVDADGMFVSETGQLTIGRLHVDAIPEGTASAVIHYSEDTPLLQPSMKTHDIDVILTGTNSVSSATNIVRSICEAFAKVAAAKGSATAAPESPDSPTPTPTSN